MNNLSTIGFYTLSDQRVQNASSTSQMKRCEMIITEYCNFRCPYCRGLESWIYGDRNIKQLSISEIKRNIDLWCIGQPLENIRFSGGEPTLHKNIIEAISYSKNKGINRIAISTNGSNKLGNYYKLINAGANDFSISLDGCCASDVTKMSGGLKVFDTLSENIFQLSKRTYVTVGIVLTPDNINKFINTVKYADSLGVSDIRVIPSAQWNGKLPLNEIPNDLLQKYPILNYRVNNFKNGINVRGITKNDSHRCGLVLDDSVIAGDFHFPCVIYMREKGKPIGKISSMMRQERYEYYKTHNSFEDSICRKNCLDVCIAYNNKFQQFHGE